jgi:S1-C subfamily serine protease
MKKVTNSFSIIIILGLLLSACSVANALPRQAFKQITKQLNAIQTVVSPTQPPGQNTISPTATAEPIPAVKPTTRPTDNNKTSSNPEQLGNYENTLENIYNQVGPSVVNIQVISQESSTNLPGLSPSNPTPYSASLGSGFVWDMQGHIVTNNHVIDGATKITVTFSNGDTYTAKTIGTDPSSDLAVIMVNVPASLLKPVTLADSSNVKVGQIAIAIGTPFGLQGSMTVGIVSALGRSLPVEQGSVNGTNYQIPDVIQTDAAINPGNSGGVLVDDQGQVIGVTSAIQSSTNSNSGIGFVIPSDIVSKVIPSLIKTGTYKHSWLGITGTTLSSELAQAMNLEAQQRGALVEAVTTGGPADKSGLRGSSKNVTINGQDIPIGGDVIIAVDQQPVQSMDDVIAYLADNTNPGQKITVTVLRNGQQENIDITLGERPSGQSQQTQQSQQSSTSGAYLGIVPVTMTSDIARAMNLDNSQTGVLITGVKSGSPADKAGFKAGTSSFVLNGQTITIGGDIIIAVDNQPIATTDDLRTFMASAQPDQVVKVTILRAGSTQEVSVTLAALPLQ